MLLDIEHEYNRLKYTGLLTKEIYSYLVSLSKNQIEEYLNVRFVFIESKGIAISINETHSNILRKIFSVEINHLILRTDRTILPEGIVFGNE